MRRAVGNQENRSSRPFRSGIEMQIFGHRSAEHRNSKALLSSFSARLCRPLLAIEPPLKHLKHPVHLARSLIRSRNSIFGTTTGNETPKKDGFLWSDSTSAVRKEGEGRRGGHNDRKPNRIDLLVDFQSSLSLRCLLFRKKKRRVSTRWPTQSRAGPSPPCHPRPLTSRNKRAR